MKIDSQLSFTDIPADQASSELLQSKAWQEMVEIAGRVCQVLGFPRSTGQIFGLLYFSSEPLSLNQISAMLCISKSSASTGTRHLATWGSIRKVWAPGERRDYYEIVADFGTIMRGSYDNLIKPKLKSSEDRIASLKKTLQQEIKSGVLPITKKEILEDRIDKLERLHKKFFQFLPLIEKFMDFKKIV